MNDPSDDVPPSRTVWVTDRLRQDIFSGRIPPGTRLRNRDLQERYVISATPLREALQRLASEGLVVMTPQLGAQVSGLDRAEAEQLYELRLMLEPQAIRRSLRRAPDERREQIGRAYSDMAVRGDASAFAAHNAFHRLMRADCDSGWMLRIVDQLAINCERYRRLDGQGHSPSVLDEHARLWHACEAGQADLAADIMTEHLVNIRDRIRASLPYADEDPAPRQG
jgi:GntR family transcriptional regulator, carbon starvation induced regulator